MNVIHVKEQNFDELVKEGIVLVDFYADWCGPCKMLGPIIETFANERADVKVIKINVDEREELAGHFNVISIPTLMLFKDGVMISERKGFHTADMLNEWIASVE